MENKPTNRSWFSRHIDGAIAKLSLSYLLVIMAMSIGFSYVFYRTSTNAFDRPLPPHKEGIVIYDSLGPRSVETYLEQRFSQSRDELLNKLILLNLLALIGGAALSYLLAAKSLEPVRGAMLAQERFVSDASHELKTPLTAIRAQSEVALRNPKLNVKEAKQVINTNLAEAIRLQALSEGLLKLASSDGADVVKTRTSLNKVVTQVLDQTSPLAQEKKIKLQLKLPRINVAGNYDALVQAVSIVLDNAIKYSADGTTIHVDATRQGRSAVLSIKDQGQGIKAADLPRIFERFYRADTSRSRNDTPGYGLGLSIAKQIIAQHDGEIIVHSIPGKGSTFTIKLPLALNRE